MKFSTREDIDAPIEQVFAAVSDFETFERQAIRRGADVTRVTDLPAPGVGMQWAASFVMRGRQRSLRLTTDRFEAPHLIAVRAESDGIESDFVVELIALSRSRTRMTVGLDLRPKNLSARLLVQSLKLAKNTLTKRFKLRVAEYARSLEERLRASA